MRGPLYDFVEGRCFRFFSALVITVNAGVVTWLTDWSLRNKGKSHLDPLIRRSFAPRYAAWLRVRGPWPPGRRLLNDFWAPGFLLFYLIEVVLRGWVSKGCSAGLGSGKEPRLFFCQRQRRLEYLCYPFASKGCEVVIELSSEPYAPQIEGSSTGATQGRWVCSSLFSYIFIIFNMFMHIHSSEGLKAYLRMPAWSSSRCWTASSIGPLKVTRRRRTTLATCTFGLETKLHLKLFNG